MSGFTPEQEEKLEKWRNLQIKLDNCDDVSIDALIKEFTTSEYDCLYLFLRHEIKIRKNAAKKYEQLCLELEKKCPYLKDNADEFIEYKEVPDFIKNDDFGELQKFSSTRPDFFVIDDQSDYPNIDDAAEYGATKCFRFFLMNGQMITSATTKKAIFGGSLEIIHICEQNGMAFDTLINDAINYHRNDVLAWIQLHAKTEIFIDISECIMCFNFSLLMEHSTDRDLRVSHDYNEIPIHAAAAIGLIDLIKIFVDKGMKIDEIHRNWTPLLMAAKNGNLETVKYLLKEGADIEFADENGWTAIFNAANSNKSSTAIFLYQNGASINLKDIYGFTFSSYASDELKQAIANLRK